MPSPASGNTPAVIVGADVCGLGLARSLGRAGVPVFVMDSDARRPAMHSRYVRRFVSAAIEGPGLVDGLLALREQLDGRAVLFLTSDMQVRAVSEHRAKLQTAYRIRMPDHDSICQLLHKAGFQELAERHGFRVPAMVMVRKPSDLAQLSRIRFPAVVKPGSKEAFLRGPAPRAVRVEDAAAAEAICRAVLPLVSDLIVQEWVEGPDDNIYFCLHYHGRDGRLVASFTGRKLRCWPLSTGSTASCIPAPEVADVLEPLSRAFFDAFGVVGMCSMEFKRDSRTGAFLMIEPTIGRADWQEEVATLNGVNIPLAAYRHELDLPVCVRQPPRQNVIWRDPSCYWRSLIASRSLRATAQPQSEVRSSVWRVDDPVPLAFCWLEWLRNGVKPARRKG